MNVIVLMEGGTGPPTTQIMLYEIGRGNYCMGLVKQLKLRRPGVPDTYVIKIKNWCNILTRC